MEFKRKCTACGNEMEIDEALLNQAVICPHCSTVVEVPGANEPKRFDHAQGPGEPMSLARTAGLLAGYMGMFAKPGSRLADIRKRTNYFWFRAGVSACGILGCGFALITYFETLQIWILIRIIAYWVCWRAIVMLIDAADCLVELVNKCGKESSEKPHLELK